MSEVMAQDPDSLPAESRKRPRFVLRTLVPARFYGFEVALADISESGCQIHHGEPLKIGAAGQFQLQNPSTRELMCMDGRVVWSRLAQENASGDAAHAYHSALSFGPLDSFTHTALAKFVAAYAHFDRAGLEKKRQALARKSQDRRNAVAIYKSRDEIPVEVLDRIMEAREHLQLNPLVGQKWYQRARFTKDHSRNDRKAQYCDEVLAVWELLGHRYPVNVVALALNLA